MPDHAGRVRFQYIGRPRVVETGPAAYHGIQEAEETVLVDESSREVYRDWCQEDVGAEAEGEAEGDSRGDDAPDAEAPPHSLPDDFDSWNKGPMVALAEEWGLEVASTGSDPEVPLKADYERAIRAAASTD